MKKAIRGFLFFVIVFALAGCRSLKETAPVGVPTHDTLWQQHYSIDTVYTDRWHYIDRKGDTVWLVDSVTIYRAKYIRDTVREVSEVAVEVPVEVVREVERPLTFEQQLLIRLGWLVGLGFFAVLVYIAYRIWRRR